MLINLLFCMSILNSRRVHIGGRYAIENFDSALSALVNETADQLESICVAFPDNPAMFPFIADPVYLDNNHDDDFDIQFTSQGHRYSQIAIEMVQQGAAIIPFLCSHLTDSRKSKLAVGGFIDKYYDGRGTPGNKRHPYSGIEDGMSGDHLVTAGDLCYFLLGQIVNRQLGLQWKPLKDMWYVNMPSIVPSLAKRARNEWAHTTSGSLRSSLIHDVIEPDRVFRDELAIRRLKFYYPAACAHAVAERLQEPMFPHGEGMNEDPGQVFRLKRRVPEIYYIWLYRAVDDLDSQEIDDTALTQLKEQLSHLTRNDKKESEIVTEACLYRLRRHWPQYREVFQKSVPLLIERRINIDAVAFFKAAISGGK